MNSNPRTNAAHSHENSSIVAAGSHRRRGGRRKCFVGQSDPRWGTGDPAGGEPGPLLALPAARGGLLLQYGDRDPSRVQGVSGANLPERYMILMSLARLEWAQMGQFCWPDISTFKVSARWHSAETLKAAGLFTLTSRRLLESPW